VGVEVVVEGLTKKFGSQVIWNDVTLTLPAGEISVMLGPSGTGKSVFLKTLIGLLKPNSGHVFIEGVDIANCKEKDLYEIRKLFGVLFQDGAMFGSMDLYDNVAFPLREHTDLPEEMLRDLVLMRLNAVGLRNAAQLKPNEISGGMARRVALARAVALDPRLIMYDEPFAGLDPISMGVTANLIRNLNDALGSTSILVSHDVNETFSIVDYVYFLSAGKIVAAGTPDEMRRSDHPYVKQFVNAQPDGPVPFHYPGKSLADDLGLGGKR